MAQKSVTTNLDTWNVAEHNVERLTDNIPFTTAHPDDTLVLVGPPRYKQLGESEEGLKRLHAIGMLQSFTYSQSRALQPMQAIGSGRSYFVSGKSTVQFQIGRLFVKGKNLFRALYENAQKEGVPVTDPESWGEASSAAGMKNFLTNLDSELFLVPFGLMICYRDRTNSPLGSVYLENCMLASTQSSIAAGQTTIMESVSGLADRLFPVSTGFSGVEGWPVGSPKEATNETLNKVETYLFGEEQKIGNADDV